RPGLTRAAQNSGAPLPEPMRTSAGFFDTGTSGKTRIQTRPARFMWRVMARRAASIWRAVRRSGSIAFRPNEPKSRLKPPLAAPFHARDLGAAQAARAVDADALGAQAHRRLHGALHGAAEGDAAFELLGDVLGDQGGVDLGLADLDDVEGNLALGHLGKIGAQLLDVGALLADHHARTGGVDGDAGALGRPLDDDLGDARLAQPLAQDLPDVDVLVQHGRVFAAFGVPARVPGPVD